MNHFRQPGRLKPYSGSSAPPSFAIFLRGQFDPPLVVRAARLVNVPGRAPIDYRLRLFCEGFIIGLAAILILWWTERLYAAIPTGADLKPVRHKLAIRRLTRLADAQRKALESATDGHGLADAIRQVLAALDKVLACHRAGTGETDCVADWSAAWSAARSAAWQQEADDLIEILEQS